MLQCYDFNILVYSVISSSAPDNVWGGILYGGGTIIIMLSQQLHVISFLA